MNRRIFFAIAVIAIAVASCNTQNKVGDNKVELKTDIDSTSYSIGMQIASNLKQEGLDSILNMDMLYEGISNFVNDKAILDFNSTFEIIQNFSTKQMAKQFESKIKEGEDFLSQNAKREGIITTESGLQYEIINAGQGPIPTINNTVIAHYSGKLIDGTVFDSSYERGEPISFSPTGVIKGWTEALQIMPVGSKWNLYIPYYLGYGERGAGQHIQPYETLIFEIELLRIEN